MVHLAPFNLRLLRKGQLNRHTPALLDQPCSFWQVSSLFHQGLLLTDRLVDVGLGPWSGRQDLQSDHPRDFPRVCWRRSS